jgi:hypothetical protein
MKHTVFSLRNLLTRPHNCDPTKKKKKLEKTEKDVSRLQKSSGPAWQCDIVRLTSSWELQLPRSGGLLSPQPGQHGICPTTRRRELQDRVAKSLSPAPGPNVSWDSSAAGIQTLLADSLCFGSRFLLL